MAERELGFLKPRVSVSNVKELSARMILKNVRSKGHTYVDLREDGKSCIFFCMLCLAPCYSDTVLFEHLNGSLHKERLLAAKVTLIRRNPWPFDDGVLFFGNDLNGDEKVVGKVDGLDESECECEREREREGDLAIVVHDGGSRRDGNGVVNGDGEKGIELLIPGVIGKDDVSDLNVQLMGYGKISARLVESDGISRGMQRIWCEWLGKSENDTMRARLASHDFTIVTFGYHYDLGKQGLFDGIKTLLLTCGEESNGGDGSIKRRKKLFSDSEDATGESSYHCDLSGDDSQGSMSPTSSALVLHRYDGQLIRSRILSSKTLRRELRRQQRVASEKLCDICQHKMLPGKDVATLLNLKTGRLACSSRNVHGAFHVFHTSCLIHWILLCEYEMFMKPPVKSKVRRRSKRMTKSKLSQVGKESKPATYGVKRKRTRKHKEGTFSGQIYSVFCPDCQGTGLLIEGSELEKPTIPLSQIFRYKIKAIDAHREWMKYPENLENCSTGFAFKDQVDHAEGMVSELKLLHIYRADDDNNCQTS